MICPSCASNEVVPILYGLPHPEADTDDVELGGCIIRPRSPTHHCRRCGAAWRDDAPPVRCAVCGDLVGAERRAFHAIHETWNE